MKKIASLWMLPIIVLTWCYSNWENGLNTNENENSSNNVEVNDNTSEELDKNIDVIVSDENNIKTFTLNNDDGTTLSWKLKIISWIVESITFDEEIDTSKGYTHKFANKIKDSITWKELNSFNLPADVVSGSSSVAYQFNDFLKTLK